MTTSLLLKRVRLCAAWALGAYFAHMYVVHGWIKFDPNGFWTQAFERWGYPVWLRWLVGFLELVGGALLVIPWLASYGALAVLMVMAGAWFTRAGNHRWVDVAWISAYALGLAWIAWEWWDWRWRPRPRRPAPPVPPT